MGFTHSPGYSSPLATGDAHACMACVQEFATSRNAGEESQGRHLHHHFGEPQPQANLPVRQVKHREDFELPRRER